MVQSLKLQLEHALVKRPEMYSMEDTWEQLMTRLNDVTSRGIYFACVADSCAAAFSLAM